MMDEIDQNQRNEERRQNRKKKMLATGDKMKDAKKVTKDTSKKIVND
jgi:hypothetical protein